MKIKILILTLLAITLGACNKALDMAPDGKITMDEVFADHEKVAAFLNSCYTNMPAKGTRTSSGAAVRWNGVMKPWIRMRKVSPGLCSAGCTTGTAQPGTIPSLDRKRVG